MILDVKYWPHPCLKKVAEDIDATDPYTEIFIEELFNTMYAMRGMGLAATQCNINKRVLVIDATQAGGKEKRAFINPVIKEVTDQTIITEEGCLSFPGIFAKVERADGVIVETDTLTGEREDVILTSVDAVCFQHELDHLNGITFLEYLKPVKRQMSEKKLRKNLKLIKRRQKR